MPEPKALNLIKLCVGCDSIADLEEWIAEKLAEKKRRRQPAEHIHTTRMLPKRAEELIGSSLYWVIRGQISCRERILAIRTTTGKDGIRRCQVVMDGKLVLVEPRPRSAPTQTGRSGVAPSATARRRSCRRRPGRSV